MEARKEVVTIVRSRTDTTECTTMANDEEPTPGSTSWNNDGEGEMYV